ncbi:MAG: EAL domain-containing protein [Geminicoccaceae bacterium]|nr:EAL domain-containing protein [Geminicoccaceae bacterium]
MSWINRRSGADPRPATTTLQQLFDQIPVGIYETNTAGRLVSANRVLADMLGYASPRMLLANVRDFCRDVHAEPADRRQFMDILRNEGAVAHFDCRMTRADGSELPVSINARAVRNASGRIRGIVGAVCDISLKVEARLARERAEADYLSLFDNAIHGIYRTSAKGDLLAANPALAHICGYNSPQELMSACNGAQDGPTAPYVDPSRHEDFRLQMDRNGSVADFVSRLRRRDGEIIWIRENARAVHDGDGELLHYEGTVEDITAIRQLEESRELQARAAVSGITDALLIYSKTGDPVFVNNAFETMFGHDLASLRDIGGIWRLTVHPNDASHIYGAIRRRRVWSGEVEINLAGGGTLPVEMRLSPLHGDDGQAQGAVIICTDITTRRQVERKLVELAGTDPLTGLRNRLAFNERLDAAVDQTSGWTTSLAVLCLDLDRFKEINDTLGHAVGDDLLVAVANRLRDCCSETDLLARLGGDEFAIVQVEVGQPEAARRLARRVVESLGRVFRIGDHRLEIGGSIGIALSNEMSADTSELMRHADIALYRAKSGGGNRYRIFEQTMHRELIARRDLTRDLRAAVESGSLTVNYQPQLNLQNGSVDSVEALVRWKHSTRGMVPPSEFIPLAEESELICDIGALVLQQAARDIASFENLKVAVNLSPAQIRHDDFDRQVFDTLTEVGLPTGRLVLEITEGVLLHDTTATLAMLHRLKARGTRIAMDDFGSGYSSLSYIRRFPFDKIKLDGGFVAGLGSERDAEAIVGAVATLGTNLGIRTIAEGVETMEQLHRVKQLGCDAAQGYLIARPMTIDALRQFLARDCSHLLDMDETVPARDHADAD